MFTYPQSGKIPQNFYNQFPQQINLSPNSEVCCLGYSGLSSSGINGGTDFPTSITIKKDINDSFVVYHGEIADGTTADEFQTAPFAVKMPPGVYSLTAPGADSFSAYLQTAINEAETNQEFYFPNTGGAVNGWSVAYDAPNGKFTIKAIQGRNRRTEPGDWERYMNSEGGQILYPPVASGTTTLSPHRVDPAHTDNRFFINQREAFLGSNKGQNLVPPDLGFCISIDIDATTTYADLGVAFGYSVLNGISMWNRNR